MKTKLNRHKKTALKNAVRVERRVTPQNDLAAIILSLTIGISIEEAKRRITGYIKEAEHERIQLFENIY